jgi:putative transposase
MTAHAFHEILLHINWHNSHDKPLAPGVEQRVQEAIREKCRMTEGVYLHGIGGTETHVHIAISMEPTVQISDVIGQMKGAASHAVNERCADHPIEWQRGYGVVSFSKRDLPWVIAYIQHQKQHHASGTLSPKLERTDAE